MAQAQTQLQVEASIPRIGNLRTHVRMVSVATFLSYALRGATLAALVTNNTIIFQQNRMTHCIRGGLKYPGFEWHKLLQKRFATSKIAKVIWESKNQFFINKTMKHELAYLLHICNNIEKTKSVPILHITQREYVISRVWGVPVQSLTKFLVLFTMAQIYYKQDNNQGQKRFENAEQLTKTS